MKRFIRLSYAVLFALCGGIALTGSQAFSMTRSFKNPSKEQIDLGFCLDMIFDHFKRLSYLKNDENDLIVDAAEKLQALAHIDYEQALQTILNHCVHELIIKGKDYYDGHIYKLLISGADINSLYNPEDQSDPQHFCLPVHARNFDHNQTPLMLAVQSGKPRIVNLIMNIADARMKDRASLTAQDSQGNTALILATKNICGDSMNSFEIVKMLVSSNIISSPKALKIAAQCWPQCPKDIFDFYVGSFLSNDINDINDISVINIQNNMGNTALMYAAKCKDYGIVKHLIANGADTTLKNNLDQTAFELAPDGPVKGLLRRQPH